MSTQDHNKKTQRQFQCRDYLWEIFEQMGAELECSTDYLVNEAMRQYARSRNWGSRGNRASQPGNAPIASQGSTPGAQAPRALSATGPIATSPQQTQRTQATAPAPSSPALRTGGTNAATAPVGPAPSRAAPATGSGSLPPPLPSSGSGNAAHPRGVGGRMPSLFVIFNGQKIPVNKEEFVIGRGSKTADLPIKDGNISRRHAAIVFQNGGFYMKDLGSTNGIEFAGERVDVKPIEEGDIFQLCDYELRFTYR